MPHEKLTDAMQAGAALGATAEPAPTVADPRSHEAMAASGGGQPPGLRRRSASEARVAALLIAPALALLAAFTYLPALLSLVASFFDVPLNGGGWTWVGTDNYEAMVADAQVRQAAWNTLLYCIFTIVPSVALGLGGALLADSLTRGRALVSAFLFLPLTANLVAMAVVFEWIFAANGGFANQALEPLGIGPVNFLGDGTTALPTVATVGLWRSASFCMVLFLAGLTTIPTSVHEAAAMDGLRGWAKLRQVVVPLLRPTVLLATVVATIQAVQTFDTVNVMTGGGPLGQTESILTMTWRIGFGFFRLGEAAALSFLLLIVLLALGWFRRRSILGGAA